MQFLASATLLLTALSTALASSRADTIKAGLKIVGNQQHDQYHDHKKAATGAPLGPMMHHANEMRKAKNTNNRIASAVGGVKRVHKRSFYDDDEFEFIARDDTHEYFARALPEEELYARDLDFEDLYY